MPAIERSYLPVIVYRDEYAGDRSVNKRGLTEAGRAGPGRAEPGWDERWRANERWTNTIISSLYGRCLKHQDRRSCLKHFVLRLRFARSDSGFGSFYVRLSTITAITDDRSQIQVHTDEWTQVHGARSSLVVTTPSTNRGLMKVPLSIVRRE